MADIEITRTTPFELLNHIDLADMPDLTGVISDHDARYYTEVEIDTMLTDGTIDHLNLSNVTPNQHHAQFHTVVSHSDTTATGAELDTLTDNSMADTLHRHSELVASDGAPDPAVSVDGNGIVSMPWQSGCRVRLTSNQTIPPNVWTKLLLATEDYDIQGEFDNVTNYRFTATRAGYYQVNLNGYLTPVAAQGRSNVGIYKNGALYSVGTISNAPIIVDHDNFVGDIIYLDVDDYIEGYVFHNSGGTVVATAALYYNYMSIMKIA